MIGSETPYGQVVGWIKARWTIWIEVETKTGLRYFKSNKDHKFMEDKAEEVTRADFYAEYEYIKTHFIRSSSCVTSRNVPSDIKARA